MHRALLSVGRNPIHVLALTLKDYIKIKKKVTWKRILIDFYDSGNEEEIQQALQFLENTGQITSATEEGGVRIFQ